MLIRQLILLTIITLSVSFPSFALSRIEASIDRNPAVEGQYLVLTITADDDVNTAKLDTSALLKDFTVGRMSVSRNTQIINFSTSRKTTWQVMLSPLHSGNIKIPAMTIEGVNSDPIMLMVTKAENQPEQMESLFIRGNVSTDEAYVGQMIIYKVKLYLAVDLQRGVLSAPTLDGAQIKQLGEDTDNTEIIKGKRYRVIERTYSIIADQPGELTIDGASFSGDVLMQSSRRGNMFSFNESKPMQTKAPKLIILINPIPNEFNGEWLVSDLVALNEDWPTEPQEYEVGLPITRTINLLASNTDETSLPQLDIQTPAELKIYPEKAQRKTFLRDQQMVSQLTQTLTIVPTKAGTYILPEILIPWWNPHTKQQESASLPARTIKVTGSQHIASKPTPLNFNANKSATNEFWPWLTLLFAILWIVTLFLWRKALTQTTSVNQKVNKVTPHPLSPKNTGTALQIFTAACHEEDAGKVLFALQTYFNEVYKKPMALNEIAGLSNALNHAINELQVSAFSRNKSQLNYQLILSAVSSAPDQVISKSRSPLAQLNPR